MHVYEIVFPLLVILNKLYEYFVFLWFSLVAYLAVLEAELKHLKVRSQAINKSLSLALVSYLCGGIQ